MITVENNKLNTKHDDIPIGKFRSLPFDGTKVIRVFTVFYPCKLVNDAKALSLTRRRHLFHWLFEKRILFPHG